MPDNPLGLVWGAPNIAKATGRSVRAIYHIIERMKAGDGPGLPGLKKMGGRYCFDPAEFRAAMREPGRTAAA